MNNDFLHDLIQHHTSAGAELVRRIDFLASRHIGQGIQTDEELELRRKLAEHNVILNRLTSIVRQEAGNIDAASWETACATLLSTETYQALLEYAHLIANNRRILGLFSHTERRNRT